MSLDVELMMLIYIKSKYPINHIFVVAAKFDLVIILGSPSCLRVCSQIDGLRQRFLESVAKLLLGPFTDLIKALMY